MEHRAKLYRWVRASPPIPTTTSSPVVTGTPDMQLAEAHRWWSKLWDPDLAPAPETSRFGQCLSEYEAPPPMPAFTGADVRAVLRVTPTAKAAGHDGWQYAELKAWPDPMIQLLAAFYGTVERCGRWPRALSNALVARLPKGTTGLAEDYRPIMLLSTIYRVWAKSRGDFLQAHLRRCGILPAGPAAAASRT